jgi:hypothetical protein
MSKPFYFAPDALECFTLDEHRDIMRDDGLTTLTVYRAKPLPTSVAFWCRHHREAGESGDGMCGRHCNGYAPRNGKNGRCKHHTHCHEPDMDKPYTITLP